MFVPTPETFGLIALAREKIRELGASSIADIGTGTGIIALALANSFPDQRCFATDANETALELARYNADKNNILNVRSFRNDSLTWVSPQLPAPINLIVSNPPYIGNQEYTNPQFLQNYPEAAQEPQDAIRTYDEFGARPYVRILAESERLAPTAYLFQCNTDNLCHLQEHLAPQGFQMSTSPDHNGNDRFLFLQRKHKTD